MLTRRHLQLGLGILWLFDAALQYQPYMFSAAFPKDEVAGTASGQPGFIADGVQWAAHLMTAAPVATNAAFATVQLLLAIGLFYRRTVRLALIGSVFWALSVWYFGEALGGIASGAATIVTGAPGAAVLYAIVAIVAWPTARNAARNQAASWSTNRWTAIAPWALVWCGSGVLQLLPAQQDSWRFPTALGAVLIVVGILPMFGRQAALAGAVAGSFLGLTFWIFGQSFGDFWTGQATDLNTGPLLVLLALALVVRTVVWPAVQPVVRPVERTSPGSAFEPAHLLDASVGRLRVAGPVGLHSDPTRRSKRTKVA